MTARLDPRVAAPCGLPGIKCGREHWLTSNENTFKSWQIPLHYMFASSRSTRGMLSPLHPYPILSAPNAESKPLRWHNGPAYAVGNTLQTYLDITTSTTSSFPRVTPSSASP